MLDPFPNAQVEKRERERFRLTRPPRLVCDHCGEAFASAKEQRRHAGRREVHHEAWVAAEREASRRFHPVRDCVRLNKAAISEYRAVSARLLLQPLLLSLPCFCLG